MTHYLHFTFGPVQSFVAQARRTRDLYAGSYLLSHLATTAMKAAKSASGILILPKLEEILSSKEAHALAPNRFIAEFHNAERAKEAAQQASQALLQEWTSIAEKVWQQFVVAATENRAEPRAIWKRQIAHFWEISWVIGPKSPDELDLLDRRKNWRTPPVTKEPGDHCTLMGDWQEISGYTRSGGSSEQQKFWERVKELAPSKLDLEDDERLCAIAMVKRYFPYVFRRPDGSRLDMENWPSTVSIAALPWQLKIKEKNDPDVLKLAADYAKCIEEQGEPGAFVSSARKIPSLSDFDTAGRFNELSGNFLNATTLENKRGTHIKDDPNDHKRNHYLQKLRELEQKSGDYASNFYAILLMDGDSMGKLIRDNSPQAVTDALTRFCRQAVAEVKKYDGITIYAGGDDLLAVLPLPTALACVSKVRGLYVKSFQKSFQECRKPVPNAHISAGLVFAHWRNAFSRVLQYARELLKQHAKGEAGRDAIAIGVLKPSGPTCRWVGKFSHFENGPSHCFQSLINAYSRHDRDDDSVLTASFLYNLQTRFREVFDNDKDIARADFAGPEEVIRLFVAEYLHGRIKRDPEEAARQRAQATALMEQLYHVCKQSNTAAPGGFKLSLDGLRLIKFLALDGKEGAE